jgi:hypothetical protein
MRARKLILVAVIAVVAVAAARVSGLWVGGQLFPSPTTPATSATTPANPRSISVQGGTILVSRNESFRVVIPVKNETTRDMRFSTPGCGCGCQTPSWERNTVAVGESTNLIIDTLYGDASRKSDVACSWTSDDGLEWSARWNGTVLNHETLATERVALGAVAPVSSIRREIHFHQHARTAETLPPVAKWTCSEKRVTVGTPTVTVEPFGDVVRRTTVVPVEVATGRDVGTFWAMVKNDRVPEGVEVSWKIAPQATVTPHTWVVSATDFTTDKTLQQTFRVQADGRKVTAATPSDSLKEYLTTNAQRDTDSVSLSLTRPPRTVVGEVELTLDPPTPLRVVIPVAFVAP